MDITRAKEILQSLADGVDPTTGEVLSAEDVCNQPDVIRALHVVLGAVVKKNPAPANAGVKWTRDEIDSLLAEFDSGMSVPEIAEAHGRSKGAIHSKLVAFGRVRLSYPPAEKG